MIHLLTLTLAASGYQYILSGSAADVTPATRPGYLLAGGGGSDDASHRWFLERAGYGDIVVLRASGSDGYHPYFAELGPVDSVETILFRDVSAADDPFVLDRIRRAEGIFLAGGDQWNYVRYWRGTAVGREINAAIARGVPIGGSSAGLAVLGEFAFTAERDTVTSAQALADPFDPHVTLLGGFLKIPALRCLITDSHFSQRDRLGRLLVFLGRLRDASDACPAITGIGIDEGTSVQVEPDGAMKVSGRGSAWVLKLRSKPGLKAGVKPSIAAVEAERLPAGSKYVIQVGAGLLSGDPYGNRLPVR